MALFITLERDTLDVPLFSYAYAYFPHAYTLFIYAYTCLVIQTLQIMILTMLILYVHIKISTLLRDILRNEVNVAFESCNTIKRQALHISCGTLVGRSM